MKNLNLKKLLKTIKLNESSVSFVLGLIVIIIVGSLVIKYLKTNNGILPTNSPTQENSISLESKTHKVVKGENLWSISVKYYGDGFKWVDIATENKLDNASIIEIGQVLIIPNKETVLSETETENSITSASYEVVKGDTLWNISVRAYGDGYQWVKIASENKIVHPNTIHTGNILIIPR